MTRTALVIHHLQFEDLGTLAPLLRERGYELRYVEAPVEPLAQVDVDGADLMVVLGGPIGAYDDETYPFVREEVALVARRLALRKPLLGICLGAQLIARALGARVAPMGVKEIGFGPLRLTPEGQASALAAIGDTPVLHWHGDQFEIPPGAQRLAETDTCPNQAFALGRQVLGLQFHLEADLRLIERWLVGHACELGQAAIDPRTVRLQARELQPRLEAAVRAVFTTWLDGLEKN